MKKLLFSLMIAAMLASHAQAKVVYVNKNAVGDVHDGTTWANAFLTVQAGVAAAAGGDEVWVARGTYVENSLAIPAGMGLYGGFAGSETTRTQRDVRAYPTILDGTGSVTGTDVVECSYPGAVVDGFTVRNGFYGVYISDVSTLANCTITGNSYVGVYMDGTATVANNVISQNAGSGVEVNYGTATLTNNTITANVGDGVLATGGAALLTNNIVAFNGKYGVNKGAGRFQTLAHNDVFANTAGGYYVAAAGATDIALDPVLTNALRDIHLRPGSPCIDAGDDSVVTVGQTDMYGKPRIFGSHVDIGADEFDGTVWPAVYAIWHVASTGLDSYNGTTWNKAKKTLAGALSMASMGDEIWVRAGTYTENVYLKSGVSLYGGFAGDESTRAARDARTHTTIVDGGAQGSVFTGDSSITMNAVVDGFTIRNGSAYYGAAFYLPNCVATVSNNIITRNDATYAAGGVYCSGNVSIKGNRFDRNLNGAVACYTGTFNITGNLMTNHYGICVYCNGGNVTIANNTMVGNSSTGASGIHVSSSGATIVAVNNIIAFNDTGTNAATAAITFRNNLVYGNGVYDYSGVNPTGTNHNISVDPLFQISDPVFHLLPGSPCIDAGDDSVVTAGQTDVDGNPRTFGTHVDIGSDEFDGTVWPPVPARTWYVATTGSDSNDGSAWSRAKKTVAAGLSAANVGDQVWVARGTYSENVSLPPGVALYGGFAGVEAHLSERDLRNQLTVLDGGDAGSVVRAVSLGAKLDGFTLRNGEDASTGAGGAYVAGNLTMSHTVVTGNYGSGITVVYPGTATLSNDVFTGNSGTVAVGGIATNGTVTVTNTTICGNSGRGLWVWGGGKIVATNNIVSGNTTGVARQGPSDTLVLSHNDVYGNSNADFDGIGDPTGQNGNLSVAPKLSNLYHDIHLLSGSPCIDAGDDSVVQAGDTDISGTARITGAHVDIGSDEFDGAAPTVMNHIWHVASTGNDANDGSGWSMPKKTVGAALTLAQGGDEVWVARGTYLESNLFVPAGVGLYGGFAGTEAGRAGRDLRGNATILDGSAGTTAVVAVNFHGAVLDGFTVQNGTPNMVDVASGEAAITNNVMKLARGTSSSAVRVSGYGDATLGNNLIIGNGGRGVSLYFGTARLSNNVISGNAGNGVYSYFGTASLTNNTISSNGSGVYVNWGTATLTNNIVAYNNTYGLYLSNGVVGSLSHNDVFGNTTADYNGATASTTDIAQDPLFVNSAGGDYHLLPGSPCINTGDDSVVTPGDKDLDGLPRWYGAHVDIGAYESQPPRAPWTVSLGTTVSGGVTVAERIAYVPADDGRLYAYSTETGSAVAGFPVDINAAVGATVKLPSRPAVYYGKTGKAIYLTTDRGDVVRVLPTGQVAWHVRPLTGQTVSTPAVTPDGYVFVNLSTGAGPFDNFVFKLDEATGTPVSLSPFLGYTTADNIGDFSPAANSRYLYVNSGWGSGSGLTLLNQDNLAVRSSFAGGEQCLSPLLLGSDLLLASKGGKAWKMNAVTLAPDLGFGHFGVADLGAQISAAPFSDGAGNVYIGTVDGRILKWTPGTLSFTPFYTATGKIAGLTIDRTAGVLGFGTSAGSFVQVPLSQPTSASTVTPGGPISTGTVYESLTDRFTVVTDDGVLSGYPAIR